MSLCLTNPLLAAATRRLEAERIESPLLEAQLLLALAVGGTRLDILRGLDHEPTAEETARFEALLSERLRHVPLAYLRGTQEFYGLTFNVTPAVLIPRPETELLVAWALDALRECDGKTIIDVGTGSGCIAVTVAVREPNAHITAIDVSAEALAVAKENARRHGVGGRLIFQQQDGLSEQIDRGAEIIVSNPPYIPSEAIAALQPEVRDQEPRLALDGGTDGLHFYRRLVRDAGRVLIPGGWLGVEVGQGQADAVAKLMRQNELTDIAIQRDLAGIERVVLGRSRP